MSRSDAKEIAERITNEQLNQMFKKAKESITDWTEISIVNKGMTKGTAWNILAKDFDMQKNYHILAKTNMVREFAKYLPSELLPIKKEKLIRNKPFHQDPIFD